MHIILLSAPPVWEIHDPVFFLTEDTKTEIFCKNNHTH